MNGLGEEERAWFVKWNELIPMNATSCLVSSGLYFYLSLILSVYFLVEFIISIFVRTPEKYNCS